MSAVRIFSNLCLTLFFFTDTSPNKCRFLLFSLLLLSSQLLFLSASRFLVVCFPPLAFQFSPPLLSLSPFFMHTRSVQMQPGLCVPLSSFSSLPPLPQVHTIYQMSSSATGAFARPSNPLTKPHMNTHPHNTLLWFLATMVRRHM